MPSWCASGRRFVDLHAHSAVSDGQFSPADVVAMADQLKLAAIALTDHDTVDGLAEARRSAAQFPDLRFAAGIEVSAEPPSGTLHILGLGIDAEAASLVDMLATLQKGRRERNPKIVAKLQALGLAITMDDVSAVAREAGGTDDIISRGHIAEALRRGGHVRDRQQAFDLYIASGGPAYVGRQRLSPADSIAAIHAAGGLAFLAHPPQLKCDNNAQLDRIVHNLVEAGLDGIEAYCSDCTAEQTRHCIDLARQYELFLIGGSDFHGAVKPDVRMGHPRTPAAVIPDELADRLFR